EFFPDEKIKKAGVLAKLIAKYYGDYSYFKYKARKGNLHSWTYTFLRTKNQKEIFLLASVAEYSGFTIFSYQLKKSKLKIIKELNGLQLPANIIYNLLEWTEVSGNEYDLFQQYAAINFQNVKHEA